MNRFFLLLALLLTVGFNANAQLYFQQQHDPQLKIGIAVGPSISRLKGNEYINANYKSTLKSAAGLSLQIVVPKNSLSFMSNVFYERKGAVSDDLYYTNKNGKILGTSHNTFNLQYITVAGMLHIRTNGRVGLFINGGAYVAFLLKDEYITGAKDTVPEKTIDNSDGDNKLDAGFVVGAGVEIPIQKKITFSVEIRDNIGAYDINNTPRTKGGIVQTNAINFLIGVAYRFEKGRLRR